VDIGAMDARDPRTYELIGAAIRVHNELGCGFLEAVYREAIQFEFALLGIPHVAEVSLALTYRGRQLKTTYRPDFVCFDRIIVEVKAVRELGAAEMAQVINYLKASNLKTGLLLNFGTTRLQYRRFIQGGKPSVLSASSVDPSSFA
jgi:GxxExxY protein